MVVISGLGIVTALGIGVEANVQALRNEKSGLRKIHNFTTIHDVPAGELSMNNDELKLYLNIDTKQTISRTSLLGMVAVEEALNDASIVERDNIAFISATTVGGMDLTPTFYKDFMSNASQGKLRYVRQHDCASSTEMIKKWCRIGGFSTAISTACSSAANAIMMGARMIEQGLVDCVVAGGTDALCSYTVNGFKSLMILDSVECRPFDNTRSGLNLGEAAAYIVMQRADKAKKRHCILSGYANANDAHHQTAMTEEGRGAQMAMRKALAIANLHPSDIDYINVHGTGTPNNDASEGMAMRAIWGEDVPMFSSTKAFTGHTLAAAGSVEAVYSALAIENNTIWANLNFSMPDEKTNLIPIQKTTKSQVNHVISNSFGFGGNCTSLVFSRILP